MKAVRVHETGAADVLRYEDVDDPKPGAGEALVKIVAAGVNFLDVYYRSGFHWGGHHKRSLPYIPGAEAAGTVVEVGPVATDVKVGDRVAYGISNRYGSYAELCAVPSWHLYRLPSSITFETAAAHDAARHDGALSDAQHGCGDARRYRADSCGRGRDRTIACSDRQVAGRSCIW